MLKDSVFILRQNMKSTTRKRPIASYDVKHFFLKSPFGVFSYILQNIHLQFTYITSFLLVSKVTGSEASIRAVSLASSPEEAHLVQ